MISRMTIYNTYILSEKNSWAKFPINFCEKIEGQFLIYGDIDYTLIFLK